MTSIFQNQEMLFETLQSILGQSRRPDKILYLSTGPYLLDAGFPDQKITNTKLLGCLEDHKDWVQINWVENHGPYRKLLPLLQEKWDEDCIIITIDDDTVYEKDLIQNMVMDYKTHQCVISYRGFTPVMNNINQFDYNKRRPSPVKKHLYNFPTGKGGILYRPQFFHRAGKSILCDKQIYMGMCGGQDDIWFYILRMKNNIPCYIDTTKPYMIKDLPNKGLYERFNCINNKNTLVYREVLRGLEKYH